MIFLIPKAMKGKFRPISLTSCLLKSLEKLISVRLVWWLKSSGILPESQNGFRRGRSCMDNLRNLTTEIITSFVSGETTACLFLDIEGVRQCGP